MLHFACFLVEFRVIPPREPPISGTRVTANWAGERPTRHHAPLPSGDMHCRFLSFLSLCCRAPCLLCGRCCAGACLESCLNKHLFPLLVIARDRRNAPPSQAGVGFGLWLRSPVWFCRSLGRHEIKLRRKQGPTGGGVPPARPRSRSHPPRGINPPQAEVKITPPQ